VGAEVPTFESKYRKQPHAKKDGIDFAHEFLLKAAPITVIKYLQMPFSSFPLQRVQSGRLSPTPVDRLAAASTGRERRHVLLTSNGSRAR
jgi:hypothetical protein